MTTPGTRSDFEQALAKNASAKSAWARLAPSHRHEHLAAIEEAKRPATRARRIEKAVAMLADGERRPVTMSTKGLAVKLFAKPGSVIVVLNAPGDAKELLGSLPEGAALTTQLTATSANGFTLISGARLRPSQQGKNPRQRALPMKERAPADQCAEELRTGDLVRRFSQSYDAAPFAQERGTPWP